METLDGTIGWKPWLDAFHWMEKRTFWMEARMVLDVIGSQPVPFWMEARMVLDVIGSTTIVLATPSEHAMPFRLMKFDLSLTQD